MGIATSIRTGQICIFFLRIWWEAQERRRKNSSILVSNSGFWVGMPPQLTTNQSVRKTLFAKLSG